MFLAGMGGGVGLVSAIAQDVDETIYACVHKNSGSPRIVPEGTSCKDNEHALNWSMGGSKILTGEDIEDGSLASNDVTANYSVGTSMPEGYVSGAKQMATVVIDIPFGDDGSSNSHAVLISGNAMVRCPNEYGCGGVLTWQLSTTANVMLEPARTQYHGAMLHGVVTLPINEIIVLPSGQHTVSLDMFRDDSLYSHFYFDSARLTAVDLGKQP
jgi:hypothetical protein